MGIDSIAFFYHLPLGNTVGWFVAIIVIPSGDFSFEMAVSVVTNSCHPTAYRAVSASPRIQFST